MAAYILLSCLLLVLLATALAILFFNGAGGDTPLWEMGDLPGTKGAGTGG